MSVPSAAPSERLDLIGGERLFVFACFTFAVFNAAFLTAALVNGYWLIDANGNGTFTDFVNVWSAGRLVLDGNPAGAYVPSLHQTYQAMAVGHPVTGYFGWHYPPIFLTVAALLALFPYLVAFVGWIVVTFVAYLVAVRAIIGERIGLLAACAFPGLIGNFIVGQNGCLTAALIGSALLAIERRPIVAGALIGLLSYKPHFAVLFPFVLAASGHWRVFISAAVVTLLLAGLSLLAFGVDVWAAFVHSLGVVNHAILTEGRADWSKLQSLYGAVRALGGGNTLAWILQGMLIAACIVSVSLLWRSRVSHDVKAAALAIGTLLATPYIFLYDIVVLAVPIAFLIHAGRRNGILRGEELGIAAACLLILIYPVVTAPIGLLSMLIVAGLVAQRALAATRGREAAAA